MRIEDLETPAIVVDTDKAEANLTRAQTYLDRAGLKVRPHIKTHKLPHFAKRQIALGAMGITCQKLGEAEIMADAGIGDIFIPYNIIGLPKLERLAALHSRIAISVSTDNATVIDGYAHAFEDAQTPLRVMVECDTGGSRCGVQTPQEATDLAQRIADAPGLTFEGFFTYPSLGTPETVEAFLAKAVALAKARGLTVNCVSNGGSPELYSASNVPTATEYRPGTYIYSDRMQVSLGLGTLDDCALTVLATVISHPAPDRIVLDAGSKALAADTCKAPGHGHIVQYPEAIVTKLSEEHAVVDMSGCSHRPAIGEKVNVIPNHVCVVTNLFDVVNFASEGTVTQTVPVAARGKLA